MSQSSPAVDLTTIQTENRNPRSANIDRVSTEELCRIINQEDATIPGVVEACIGTIAQAIDALAPRVRQGGRVFYIGAGTSGRLGVLDASEIPPTYSAPPEQFVGLIAGGDVALRNAVEGAEDSGTAASSDLEALAFDGPKDSLIGIAASGRTPYVLGGLAYGRAKGAVTIGVACSAPSPMSSRGIVDFMIEAVTGAEVVTGSTRMKAGTATKLVLNMLSSGVMIKVGKTYGNIMVDVKPTNVKLKHRARRILREICRETCRSSDEALDNLLESCGSSVKLAAVALNLNLVVEDARKRLEQANGVLKVALSERRENTEATAPNQSTPIYLCVDAGGTKCAAVIRTKSGLSSGEAGPCNATETGVDAAVAQIQLAIDVLIGIAGIDRNGLKIRMHNDLKNIDPLRSAGSFELENDITLIAKATVAQHRSKHIVVLLAGTGSVAMTFERRGTDIFVVDRSGGWGALLGDDGSGYDIGKRAIRHALFELERARRTRIARGDGIQADGVLTNAVLEHYTLSNNGSAADLLSAIMMPDPVAVTPAAEAKRRIASCAKIVLSGGSPAAARIMEAAQSSLVDMLEELLLEPTVSSQSSTLVLAGGLMRNHDFTRRLESSLCDRGIDFQDVVHAGNPAEMGVAYLARQRGH